MNNINDLTEGVIWKKLVQYFVPIAAGTLFQQLYNAVDAIIVSKYVGTEALAAVGGSPARLVNLLIGFFVALSGGAGVVIAQYYGAQEYKMVSKAVHTSLTFCIIVGIVIGALTVAFSPEILRLLKTPDETMKDAVTYTRIYFSGSVLALVFNMGSGILRALGDSRRPFIYLVISCVCNIGLDLYFVRGLGMGVAGVAWATIIAQGVSTACVLVNLCHAEEYCRLFVKKLGIDFKVLGQMMKIGIPAGVQSAMYGVSNMILQVGINTLGTPVVAGWSMSGKIDGVYWAISGAAGTSIMNFSGQNYGAKKYGRIYGCAKTGFRLFAFTTLTLIVLILTLARPVLSVITEDTAVMENAWTIITYLVPLYILWTTVEVLTGVLRGVGDTIKPMIIVAIGVCALRIAWVLFVFEKFHNLRVLSACYPISWGVTAIAIALYYFKGSALSKKHRKFTLSEADDMKSGFLENGRKLNV